ncbi:MAG: hypothetical protein AAF809_08795 [Bacteroidota bacterium]
MAYYIGLILPDGTWPPRSEHTDDNHVGHLFSWRVGPVLAELSDPLPRLLLPDELELIRLPQQPSIEDGPFNVITDVAGMRSIFLKLFERLGEHDETLFYRWQADLAIAVTICLLAEEKGWFIEYNWGR